MSDTDLIIRPSSLADYLDCPRRFAARNLRDMLAAAGYTVGPRKPSHIGASVGTGLHAAAAHTLTARLQTGSDPAPADSEELGIVEMRDRMAAEGVDWDEITRDPNTAEKQLRRMVRSWQKHIGPTIRPQLVEQRLVVQVSDGVVMSGQFDVADTATEGNGVRIRDNKTTKVRRAAHAQLGAYGLILNSHEIEVAGAAIDHIPRVRVDAEQPIPETHEVPLREAVEDALEAVEGIGRCVDEFRRRAADPRGRNPISAFPANPASALCNARWCPAWGTNTCRVHVHA